MATGLSEGGTFRLRRDEANPLRYTGTVPISAGPANVRFRVTMRVIDATNARANLKATFTYAGTTCRAERQVVLRAVGG